MNTSPAHLDAPGQSPRREPRYECGSIIDVPKRVIESGLAMIVGVEDSSLNKNLCGRGKGWHYTVAECRVDLGKHGRWDDEPMPKPEVKPFAERIGVYESELDEWMRELGL